MKEQRKRGILAEGEVTGHAHVIDAEVVKREDGVREFSVDKPATVKHEEHKPVVIQPGKYLSDRVVEYDEDANEHQVAD